MRPRRRTAISSVCRRPNRHRRRRRTTTTSAHPRSRRRTRHRHRTTRLDRRRGVPGTTRLTSIASERGRRCHLCSVRHRHTSTRPPVRRGSPRMLLLRHTSSGRGRHGRPGRAPGMSSARAVARGPPVGGGQRHEAAPPTGPGPDASSLRRSRAPSAPMGSVRSSLPRERAPEHRPVVRTRPWRRGRPPGRLHTTSAGRSTPVRSWPGG